MRIGEFAHNAGVTVRTVRYYDRVGLLQPSGYSSSGQRLYTERDFTRLQQILTLKFIGLSLAEIKDLLTDDKVEIQHLLEQQKRILQQKVAHINNVIRSIEAAQTADDIESCIAIIKAVNMNWLDRFLTEAQQNALTTRTQSLEEQKQIGQAWRQLFEDITARRTDPAELVRRWDDLTAQFTNGDEDIAAQMTALYTHMEGAPTELIQQMQAAATFIEEARKNL